MYKYILPPWTKPERISYFLFSIFSHIVEISNYFSFLRLKREIARYWLKNSESLNQEFLKTTDRRIPVEVNSSNQIMFFLIK